MGDGFSIHPATGEVVPRFVLQVEEELDREFPRIAASEFRRVINLRSSAPQFQLMPDPLAIAERVVGRERLLAYEEWLFEHEGAIL